MRPARCRLAPVPSLPDTSCADFQRAQKRGIRAQREQLGEVNEGDEELRREKRRKRAKRLRERKREREQKKRRKEIRRMRKALGKSKSEMNEDELAAIQPKKERASRMRSLSISRKSSRMSMSRTSITSIDDDVLSGSTSPRASTSPNTPRGGTRTGTLTSMGSTSLTRERSLTGVFLRTAHATQRAPPPCPAALLLIC